MNWMDEVGVKENCRYLCIPSSKLFAVAISFDWLITRAGQFFVEHRWYAYTPHFDTHTPYSEPQSVSNNY